jgi:LysR family hydrogen peroxide-inducible transcriptional activator
MELRQLEYLVVVAEEASFSAAARRLGVQQPSISALVGKLERELKQPLLDRLPRRVVPTPAGQQVIEHARRVLAEVAEAKRRVSDTSGRLTGALTVGAIPTIAPFFLPDVIRRFEHRHPGVELRVLEETTGRLVELLARGELDLVVASGAHAAGGAPHLHEEVLSEEPLVLMLPVDHPLARKREITWAALRDERFVALHDMHCLAHQAEQVCARQRLHPPVVMHGSNLLTLAAMVTAGMGVTLVPRMMADCRRCAVRGVRFRPFVREVPTRPITLVWSMLRYRTAAARAFGEMLTSALGA